MYWAVSKSLKMRSNVVLFSCSLILFIIVVGKQSTSPLLLAIAVSIPVGYCCWPKVGVDVTSIRVLTTAWSDSVSGGAFNQNVDHGWLLNWNIAMKTSMYDKGEVYFLSFTDGDILISIMIELPLHQNKDSQQWTWQIWQVKFIWRFNVVKPKYCKTEFGAIFGWIYMHTSIKSSLHELSDDILFITLNIVVHELLVISRNWECVES